MHDGKPCKGKRGKKSAKKSLPKRGQRAATNKAKKKY
jgi:hypothetical protein